MSTLPVAHIKGSHALYLDPDKLPGEGAVCLVPWYQAMGIGDVVTLTWQGYFGGVADEPVHKVLTVDRSHLGQPLALIIDTGTVYFSETADVSYTVKFADGRGTPSVSQMQTFTMGPPGPALLPAVRIQDHEPGSPLNPNQFPDGILLCIDPAYAGMQVGDVVLAHCVGARATQSVVRAAVVDQSTVDHGLLLIPVEHLWLAQNAGEQVSISVQYARGGEALASEPLQLSVKEPLKLDPPHVENANAEGPGSATLAADTAGAFVEIPAETQIPPGAKVEMHWQGKQVQGQYIATSPVAGNARRFAIPPTYIPANMSSDESKRFPVFYRVFASDGSHEDSPRVQLKISPLPQSRYPRVQLRQGDGSSVRIGQLLNGANLEIGSGGAPPWPFIAQGQLLTIWASGVLSTGPITEKAARNEQPVTANEFNSRKIEAELDYGFFLGLQRDFNFTLKAQASFDGGVTWQPFMDTSIKLTN